MIDYPNGIPVAIMIGGQLLQGWTTMSLERQKKDMTGRASIGIFFGFVPKQVAIPAARAGAQVAIYIGGNLAFVGTLDARKAEGSDKGGSKGGKKKRRRGKGRDKGEGGGKGDGEAGIKTHIGPDQYTITLTARGKTKNLIDSSHDHKTGTITGAKTRPVVEELVKNFKVGLDWRAGSHDMDKIRFRDGAAVRDEIDRVCSEYGYYRYETRDGKLRVTDQAGPESGEALILGENIMEFEASQSENGGNNPIKVKGQRTKKNIRGKAAVNRQKTIRDGHIKRYAPLTIQHYTDASNEALNRRALRGQQPHAGLQGDQGHGVPRHATQWRAMGPRQAPPGQRATRGHQRVVRVHRHQLLRGPRAPHQDGAHAVAEAVVGW